MFREKKLRSAEKGAFIVFGILTVENTDFLIGGSLPMYVTSRS
jgi:hypothetical protein